MQQNTFYVNVLALTYKQKNASLMLGLCGWYPCNLKMELYTNS